MMLRRNTLLFVGQMNQVVPEISIREKASVKYGLI